MLKNSYRLPRNDGFSLIEILIVIAMIAILSSAILVSISGQRDKARKSRVLVELSAVIQPMMMCWSDGEDVAGPVDGGEICDGNPGYGLWPEIDDSGWSYNSTAINDSGDWAISAKDDISYICCNSTYDRCADMGDDPACADDTELP